jgi:hypothetical protein
MLLMSAQTPIFEPYRRGLRRGCPLGAAGRLNDPNVATKAWHMACVLLGNGRQKGGPFGARRQGAVCVPKKYIAALRINIRGNAVFDVRVMATRKVDTLVD